MAIGYVVYKLTFQNGKIYIGKDIGSNGHSLRYFGSWFDANVESTIPNVEGNEDIFSSFKNVLKVGFKAAAEHYKALTALTDINLLLLAPVYLKEKTIAFRLKI